MKRIAGFLAISCALALVGCDAYDWWYQREFREINQKLKTIPGVTVVAAGGNDDVTFEDIYAEVQVHGKGRLRMAQLTLDSFSGTQPFYLSRVGKYEPRITSFGYQGVVMTKTGRPVKSAGFGGSLGIGESELARDLCCPRLRSVGEAIAGFDYLESELARWPSCPDFRVVIGKTGMIYRYCVAAPVTSDWPPCDPRWRAYC